MAVCEKRGVVIKPVRKKLWGTTVSVVDALTPPEAPVITVDPTARNANYPVASIVATLGLEEVQTTALAERFTAVPLS